MCRRIELDILRACRSPEGLELSTIGPRAEFVNSGSFGQIWPNLAKSGKTPKLPPQTPKLAPRPPQTGPKTPPNPLNMDPSGGTFFRSRGPVSASLANLAKTPETAPQTPETAPPGPPGPPKTPPPTPPISLGLGASRGVLGDLWQRGPHNR